MNDALSSITDMLRYQVYACISNLSIDSILEYYYRVYAAIDQLTLEQKAALFNVSAIITVFFCASTIVGLFAGDRLIEYLKLEQRFPRLEHYFTLRRKFRWYYFI